MLKSARGDAVSDSAAYAVRAPPRLAVTARTALSRVRDPPVAPFHLHSYCYCSRGRPTSPRRRLRSRFSRPHHRRQLCIRPPRGAENRSLEWCSRSGSRDRRRRGRGRRRNRRRGTEGRQGSGQRRGRDCRVGRTSRPGGRNRRRRQESRQRQVGPACQSIHSLPHWTERVARRLFATGGRSRSRRPSKTRSNPSCSCTSTRAARSTSTSRSSKTTDVRSFVDRTRKKTGGEADLVLPVNPRFCPPPSVGPAATRSPLASVHQRDLSRSDLCRPPPLRLCLLPHPRLLPFPPSLRPAPNPPL